MKKFVFVLAAAAAAAQAGPALAADSIRIGFMTTLSGPASSPGIDQRDAFNLAVKTLDGKLGGIKAEVVTVDDQFSPDAAKQAADRLLRRDKIDVLTGIIYSNVMLAVTPSAFANKTVVVSSNAGPAQLAGKGCSPYFFSASWQNDATHEAGGKLMENLGHKRVALIAPNYPAGTDAAAGFKRFFKGEIALEMFPKLGQLDFAAEIAQLRAADVEAIYYFLPGGMGVNFSKQYSAAGMDPKIVRVFQAYDADQQMLTIGDVIEGVDQRRASGRPTSTTSRTGASSQTSRRSTAASRRCTRRRPMTSRSCSTAQCARQRQDRGPRGLPRGYQGGRLQIGSGRLQVRPQPVPDPEPVFAGRDAGRGRQVPEQAGGHGADEP